MARYKLMAVDDRGEHEVPHHRKSTKAEINTWIDDKAKLHGIDYRVGYLIKFKDCSKVYDWQWIKDGNRLTSSPCL